MNKLIRLINIYPKKGQAGWVYDSVGLSPNGVCKTITASIGGIASILVEYSDN